MGSDMQATVDNVVAINEPGSVGKVEVPPEFSGKWGDFGKDMAAIAAEQPQPAEAGELTELVVEVPAPPATPEPVQPKAAEVQPEAAATPEQQAQRVPDKFKTPDGQLDQERLLKSYSDAERELKRLQNAARAPLQDPNQAAPNQQATPQVPQTFEAQLEQDVKAKGIGPVLAQLFYAARESALQGAMQEIEGLREVHEQQVRGEELKAIAKRDPWVFTQEGLTTLTEIRKTRPWVNQSPEPWKEAYRSFLADRAMGISSGNGQQVQTPTPKAATAPPGSVAAANRTVEPTIKLDTQEAILAHVATLPKDKEAEFWKKAGFKWR